MGGGNAIHFLYLCNIFYLTVFYFLMVKLRLRQILKQKRVTQVELANRLGVSAMTVSSWITGRRYPSIETLDQISQMLDTPIAEFFQSPPAEDISVEITLGKQRYCITPEMLRTAQR